MAEGSNGNVVLMAGGDVGPIYEPTGQFADLIQPLLKQADIRFAQCERTYSERGRAPGWGLGNPGGHHSRLKPQFADIFKAANIDVMSLASNHTMDWGPDAAQDTIDLLRGMGKHTVGSGKNEEEARRPAIIERNGVKIAFLAYCSVIRDGQAAGKESFGVAPMRAHAFHSAEDFQPGTPANSLTIASERDVKAMQKDVAKAKEQADVVIVSLHWGLRLIQKTICSYQPTVAHAAIDAGADMIIGHHAHCIKAVEVYKGKVCFYSVGNFMTTGAPTMSGGKFEWNLIWFEYDEETLSPNGGRFSFPAHCRKSILVKAVINKSGIARVSFVPMFINPQAQPYQVTPSDPKFNEILKYVEWVSDQHPHKFRVEGEEVVVDTAL